MKTFEEELSRVLESAFAIGKHAGNPQEWELTDNLPYKNKQEAFTTILAAHQAEMDRVVDQIISCLGYSRIQASLSSFELDTIIGLLGEEKARRARYKAIKDEK